MAETDSKETLLSTLCTGSWKWDANGHSDIKFYENGIGEVSQSERLSTTIPQLTSFES